MENKINFFKVKPPSENMKKEIVPIAETKLQSEEKPILSLEKKFTIQVASFQAKRDPATAGI